MNADYARASARYQGRPAVELLLADPQALRFSCPPGWILVATGIVACCATGGTGHASPYLRCTADGIE